jgi:ferric-dicitrate binding protein FerR (iron transport regulator)
VDNNLKQRIEKLLAGECSSEERKALLQLLKHGDLDDFFDWESDRFLQEDAPEGAPAIPPEKLSAIKAYIRNHERSVISLNAGGWNRRWAIAAAVALFVAAGLGYYKLRDVQQESISGNNPYTVTGRNYVRIPDGSTALLDEGSTLTVLPGFGKASREVKVQGKAYFDVTHDASKPFIVHTGPIVTTVLGTAFLVDTRSNKDQVTITVTRGKVAVGDGKTVYDQLTPDQQLTVNTTDFRFKKRTVNAEEVNAWKTRYLVLDDVTMEQAARRIGERFDVSVTIQNEDVKQCVVSVWFVNNEDLEMVMTVLSKLRNATYTINGKNVTVTGGTGCAE